jgi:hypothetical protein
MARIESIQVRRVIAFSVIIVAVVLVFWFRIQHFSTSRKYFFLLMIRMASGFDILSHSDSPQIDTSNPSERHFDVTLNWLIPLLMRSSIFRPSVSAMSGLTPLQMLPSRFTPVRMT